MDDDTNAEAEAVHPRQELSRLIDLHTAAARRRDQLLQHFENSKEGRHADALAFSEKLANDLTAANTEVAAASAAVVEPALAVLFCDAQQRLQKVRNDLAALFVAIDTLYAVELAAGRAAFELHATNPTPYFALEDFMTALRRLDDMIFKENGRWAFEFGRGVDVGQSAVWPNVVLGRRSEIANSWRSYLERLQLDASATFEHDPAT
jgi:hypothetical protein